MKERRTLIAGLQPGPIDPRREEAFVYGDKAKEEAAPSAAAPREGAGKAKAANAAGRVPLTTRVRTDFAHALQRASLMRKLEGQEPNTLQDILEQALEPWLRSHGYLP